MNTHERSDERRARLFRNGRSQAVRIPKEWEMEGEEVLINRDESGNLTLSPLKKKRSLLEVLATLEPLSDDEALPDITDEDLLPLDDVAL